MDKLAVSDRENHRIEFFDFDAQTGDKFDYASTINMSAGGLDRPCNFRIIKDPTDAAMAGMVVVAGLNGPVAIMSKENAVVSLIEVGELIGDQGSKHPHDAIFLPNGDVVVGTWNPGYVSYWKRL